MKIVAYQILRTSYSSELASKVNELISAGWQPLGGVAVTCNDAGSPISFSQVIVRYEAAP